MSTFSKITLEEQQLFTEIFKAAKPIASEFTFAYVYMWRGNFRFSYAILEDHLCLISQSLRHPAYSFCPIPVNGVYDEIKFKRAVKALENHFESINKPLMFSRIAEKNLPYFKNAYGDKLDIKYLDAASDYVYNASDLINLSGKRFTQKRNHINKFMRLYSQYEYTKVDESNLHECKRILDEWAEKNEANVDIDNSESIACHELCKNWERFALKGALIKVNDRYEAFTVGEQLNPDTAVIHIEKGNTDFHGIYTLINRDFCTNEWNEMKYINRQEDLGLPGLRKAKLSYNPEFMVNKFLVKVLH